MSNSKGRRLFREYAQNKGKEAKEFIQIKKDGYGYTDILVTKDNNGQLENTDLNYENMLIWAIKTNRICQPNKKI